MSEHSVDPASMISIASDSLDRKESRLTHPATGVDADTADQIVREARRAAVIFERAVLGSVAVQPGNFHRTETARTLRARRPVRN